MNREVQLNLPITDSSVGLKDAKPKISVRRVLEFLKKSEIYPAIFQTWKKTEKGD